MPVDNLVWFSVAVISNLLFVVGGIKVSGMAEHSPLPLFLHLIASICIAVLTLTGCPTLHSHSQAGSLMSSVYTYSPALSRWSQRCSMPQPRARHASVAIDNSHLLVFGGVTISGPVATPGGVANNNNNRGAPSVVAADLHAGDDDIHWYGDARLLSDPDPHSPTLSAVKTIIRYDLRSDTWTVVGQTMQPRLESHLALLGDNGETDDAACFTPNDQCLEGCCYPVPQMMIDRRYSGGRGVVALVLIFESTYYSVNRGLLMTYKQFMYTSAVRCTDSNNS